MTAPTIHPALAEVIERLAPLERAPGSAGEAEAAVWLAQRLRDAGCDADIEAAQYHDGYARPIGTLAALTTLAGLLALRRRGRLARRQTRRAVRARRSPTTWPIRTVSSAGG